MLFWVKQLEIGSCQQTLFIFKLNELRLGQKITVERLTQLQNWKTLSVIAQAYLDMVEKNKSVEKQKAAPAVEEEKEVSKT